MSHYHIRAPITASEIKVLLDAMNNGGQFGLAVPQIVMLKKILHEKEIKGKTSYSWKPATSGHRNRTQEA